MVEFRPFSGVLYNKELANDLAQVVSQPYDKISPQMQENYYAKSPYNIIRIEKNKSEIDNNPYKTSRYYLDEWMKKGILKPLPQKAFFFLEQTFDFFGEKITRKALIGMGKLYDYKENVVYPHEQTLKGPKQDRLELIRATHINLGQIFMLYSDPENMINSLLDQNTGKELYADFIDDEGIRQKIYIIKDEILINKIEQLLEDKKLYIADGHHRYETALAYSREQQDTGYCMMSLINVYDQALRILPTHRLIKKVFKYDFNKILSDLEQMFIIKKIPLPEDLNQIHRLINDLPRHSFIYYAADKPDTLYQLTLKAGLFSAPVPESLKELDVYILHQVILDKIMGITKEDLANNIYVDYKRDPAGTVKAVKNNDYSQCFLLKPTDVESVIKVAEDKQTMPQKSTDFFPKLLTGYVIADLNRL
ncbi:MAG: DUF1015 domain-containing protein [Candidatus Margulisbacteria bacterium]|nr:DUF1015 domain-containing protein [Candidatus Margulisiibacteriota bacterium]